MQRSQDLNLDNTVSNEFSLFFSIRKLAAAPCSSSAMHILIRRCKVRVPPVTVPFCMLIWRVLDTQSSWAPRKQADQSPSFPYLDKFCKPGFIFRKPVDTKLRMTNANQYKCLNKGEVTTYVIEVGINLQSLEEQSLT